MINKKHKAVVDAFLSDPHRNKRHAYKSVYGKDLPDASADSNSSRLFKNDKVRAYMKEMEEKISQKVVVTNERIIEEYAKIAFLDPKKLFNSDGTLKNINEMDDDVAAVVAGLESEQLLEGRGEKKEAIGTLKKIKFVDKKGALDSLAKINSLFKDEVTVRHTIEDYLEDE